MKRQPPPPKALMEPPRRVILGLISLGTIFVLGILWYSMTPGVLSELVFPSPSSVMRALTRLGWNLLEHSLFTLIRVLVGWIVGTFLGIVVGLYMTRSAIFYAITNPIIEAVRPLPPVALIPFFIIWFGLGPSGQVALIALGCFMVLAVNTYVSVHNVKAIYVQVALSYHTSTGDLYRTVILPAIIPSLISGFRIAAALAFGVGIAAEFMGAQTGLGFLIMVARRTLNTDVIMLGTILVAIESYLLDSGIRAIGRRMCQWTEKPVEELQKKRFAAIGHL